MSQLSRCDGCRAEATTRAQANGWLLVVMSGPEDFDPTPLFCSWRCLAEYAAARALVESAGTEP